MSKKKRFTEKKFDVNNIEATVPKLHADSQWTAVLDKDVLDMLPATIPKMQHEVAAWNSMHTTFRHLTAEIRKLNAVVTSGIEISSTGVSMKMMRQEVWFPLIPILCIFGHEPPDPSDDDFACKLDALSEKLQIDCNTDCDYYSLWSDNFYVHSCIDDIGVRKLIKDSGLPPFIAERFSNWFEAYLSEIRARHLFPEQQG